MTSTTRALLAALLAAAATAPADTFTAPEPEDLIFYHVFVDRFANGTALNDDGNPRAPFAPTNPGGFHGGDLEGVRQKLPYIAGIGANAIWLSPILENVNSYHGYATYDWYNVDPNFGTLAELQQLVADANALGIAVYYDMVVNHCADQVTSSDSGFPGYKAPPDEYTLRWRGTLRYPAPFNSLEHFHAHGNIGDFSRPEEELGELVGLDDLKTETAYVRDAMVDIWSYWIAETGVSGFRIDTVKHVDRGFWEDFLPRLRAEAAAGGHARPFTFGEIYGADDNFMQDYIGDFRGAEYKLDAALDFQYYYTCEQVFARGTGATGWFLGRLQQREANLGAHHLQMPNFIDNHDLRRFLNTAQDVPGASAAERLRRLDLALIAMFTAPGPPIVYYGTEQDFDGGNDPNNREDMFDGQFEQGPSLGDNFNTSSPRYRLVKRLSQLRRDIEPLRRGGLSGLQWSDSGPGMLAYTRGEGGAMVLVSMNTSASTRTQGALPTGWAQGTVVANALEPSETATIGVGGLFPERVLAGQAAGVWIPQALLPPAEPEVQSISPPDQDANVPTDSAIVIAFTKPMEPSSTLAAVSIAPATATASEWDPGFTTLTLRPLAELLARTTYTVSVAATANDADGARLAYPALARFTTSRSAASIPELPPVLAVLGPTSAAISIDADGSEWAAASPQSANTAHVTAANVFVWTDALGDDKGAGAYTYPTNSAFSGQDADLTEFRAAYDAANVYFYFKIRSVNPSASFFTPYVGVAVDTAAGEGYAGSLGWDQGNDFRGPADFSAHPEALPDFEVSYTGPLGLEVADAVNTAVSAATESAHSTQTGAVELSIPRSALGLDGPLAGQRFNLIVYTGLEEFGSLREVGSARANWTSGGGSSGPNDPDVFDLAGASAANQVLDLSDYDDATTSLVIHSVLPLRLAEVEAGTDGWLLR
ncbi:MAG: alpha-amylase family glycosyl hydrolase [Candidatus Sumerlaeia bacterium]|nr:alpha-amylase family glycosyl hydrolase [Candidatus Sumerlaeia bacterium]